MYRIFLSSLFVALLFTATQSRKPEKIVSEYKKYHAICIGLGYKEKSCVEKGVVAFQANLLHSISNIRKHTTVKFDTVKLNEGSGYDVKTGKFTAPEGGVYSFSWNVLVYSGKVFHTEIVKNGTPLAYNYADGKIVKSGLYLASSSTVNIKLKKKDQVWIRVHENFGQYIYGGFWSYFSGFKM